MLRSLLLSASLSLAAAALAQPAHAEKALFAGGCFWCLQADMDHVKGVTATESGYAGGKSANPTYDDYERGGHREVVEVEFDPKVISYKDLTLAFLHSVDVTDKGGQFCDRGHAYSTAIYALTPEQAKAAREAIAEGEKQLGRMIVTPIEGAAKFWKAEDYHQEYYKSQERQLTFVGYATRADLYKRYRKGCGRDAKVQMVWGTAAYEGIGRH